MPARPTERGDRSRLGRTQEHEGSWRSLDPVALRRPRGGLRDLVHGSVDGSSGPIGQFDAGTDSGLRFDGAEDASGSEVSVPDAAAIPDATAIPDAMAIPDATPLDATTLPDATTPDATVPDAATTPDATTGPDAAIPDATASDGAVRPDVSAEGGSCSPGDVTGFVAPAYRPAVASESCPAGMIEHFHSSCLAGDAPSGACRANFGPQAPADNRACAACLLTPETAARWGAIVDQGATASVNVAGCLELKGNRVCAELSQRSDACQDYACRASCPVTDAAGHAAYTRCRERAGAGGCKGYTSAEDTCVAAVDAGVGRECLSWQAKPGATFEDMFKAVAPVFCAKPDPITRCSRELTLSACVNCCGAAYPEGARVYDAAQRSCLCEAPRCGAQCATTYCAVNPSSPDPTCTTCANSKLEECRTTVTNVCGASSECQALGACMSSAGCFVKP